jgi:dUTP pyrophosphatase
MSKFKVGDNVKVNYDGDYDGLIGKIVSDTSDWGEYDFDVELDNGEVVSFFKGELESANDKLEIKLVLLSPTAAVPKYATEGSACFDLVADEEIIIQPGETKAISTGLSMEIPVGWKLSIKPRSGISLKTPLRIANAPGTVDSDYRGEVKVIMTNINGYNGHQYPTVYDLNRKQVLPEYGGVYMEGTYIIQRGERIAQAELERVHQATFEIVSELSDTERGSGGFGHTGV